MGCCCSQLERKVSETFSDDEIVLKNVGWANLQVLTTQSGCQRQGNGALVLTREKLWFRFICCGDDELDIPLSDITRVYASRSLSMRGHYIYTSRAMLLIEFAQELVAFSLPQSESWVEQIDLTRAREGNFSMFGILEGNTKL